MTAKSWYSEKLKKTKNQEEYLELISKSFNMRSPLGKPIPYDMTPYQRDYHSQSINILDEKAKDILFIKARGISFSYSTMIELIITALYFEGQLLPIIAQREQSAKDLLDVGKWLIRNCNVKEIAEDVEVKEMEIRFKSTNSVIRPYPSSGAADAIRGTRLLRVLLDEFAFQSRDRELFAAAQDCMQGNVGQILVGSTPCGRNNMFFELIKNPIGFTVFKLPVFDPTKFDPNKSVLEQDVIPIAPWIDLEKLEIKRRRDTEIFKQENMCDFLDDSLNFIPYSLIMQRINDKLHNYLANIEENPDYVYETNNTMHFGVDVARTSDLTAISGFEKVYLPEEDKYIYVQRYLRVIKDMPLPEQQEFLVRLFHHFPTLTSMRIDSTGIGLGLYEFMKKKKGHAIRAVHFAQKVKIGQGKLKIPILERMAVNFKTIMQDSNIELLPDELQINHINGIDYNFRAKRNQFGHGDIFFANCVALLPENFIGPQTSQFLLNKKPESGKLPVLEAEEVKEAITTPLSWRDNLDRLRKEQRMSKRWRF